MSQYPQVQSLGGKFLRLHITFFLRIEILVNRHTMQNAGNAFRSSRPVAESFLLIVRLKSLLPLNIMFAKIIARQILDACL